jgi:crotonobetainyl-CoA:carnitine CoA-transferase CaiB-like acyl-CoA transferase
MPYATGLLSDFGADVVKLHVPNRIDVMAAQGPFPENDPGPRGWDRVGSLNTVSRGKQSIALDLTKPDGIAIYKELVAISDVVVESYTPRVMRKFGLDYASLTAVRPDLIMLSNTGYGHTGPWSAYGSVATSLEGTSGMCWLTGYADGPPSKAGQSYTDFLACWNALYAILVALFRRKRTGRGQWIDLSMYQVGAATIGPAIMDYMANRRIGIRMGNRHPLTAPHNVFPTRGDDRWIAIAIDSDQSWQRLRTLMGYPDWMAEPRYDAATGRLADQVAIERNLAAWTATQDGANLADRLQALGIPAAMVADTRDLLKDRHLREREFFERVQHPENSGIGARLYIGRAWKLSAADLEIRGPAPMLGEHNRQILTRLLGYSEAEVDDLVDRGVVRETLDGSPQLQPLALDEMRRRGRIGTHDPEYRRTGGDGE